MDRRSHWDQVFRAKGNRVSWHEGLPAASLTLIEHAGLTPETCIIDVGGGHSHLIDALLARASTASRCSTSQTRRWRVSRRASAPGRP